MLKKYFLFLVMAFVLLFNSFNASGQTPIIESFSPLNGDVGSTVVLSGSGFSTIASNNVVFFGTTKANVLTSPAPTSTAISVVVPSSAKDDYISVTNTASGKQGKSRVAFVTSNSTIANTSSIFPFNNSQSFSSVTLATGNGWSDPTNDNNLEVGDLDLDGKPDIVKGGANGIGIYRNTSTVGVLSASSFTSALTLSPTNTGVRNIAIADVDNDGKLDVLSVGTSVVSIFRNTTISAGNISFAEKVDISTTGWQLRVADMNNDGLIDIILGGGYNTGSTIKIYKNTTTGTSITFATAYQLTTPDYGRRLDIGDMNNDGSVDIISYGNSGTRFYINQSSPLNFSFTNNLLLSTGVYAPHVFDLNRDGLNDFTGDDYSCISTSSTLSTSSFTALSNTSVDFFTFVDVGDLSGDGYPEIIRVSSSSNYSFAKYRLNALASTNTFSDPVNVPNSYYLGGEDGAKPKIIDFDGDGKKDIIFATGATGASAVIDQSTFLIYRNTIGEPVDFYPDAVSYSGLYLNYLHTTNYWKTAAGVSSSQSFSSSDCILNVNASGGNAYQGSSDAPWSLSSTFKFYNSFYLNIGYYPLYHSGPNQNYSSSAYIKFTSSGTYGRPVQDSPVLFPIGRATYNPITITNNTGSIDDYKILINDAVYKTGTSGTLALNSIQREWIVTKTNANTAGTGTTLKFDWSNSTSAVNGTVTTPALFIYNTTTAKWEKFTTGVNTSGNTLTVTGYTGVLNGTKFAIGDNTTGFPYETITTSGTLTAFQRCSPNVSATQTFAVSGTNLQANISISAPSGMQISSNGGTSWATSLTLSPTSGTVSSTTISVRMASNSTSTSGNISLTSTGATSVNISVTGTTVTGNPVVTTTSGYTCGTGTVALSASATNSPTAYAFYSASSGGSLLSSTNSYTTPSISSTTTYWVQATNACGTTNPRVAVTASVYTAPAITVESLTTQTICQNFSSTALSVTATGQGLSYQWYSNSSPSNSGGAPISGATASSYSPSTSALGTNYYYVVVSGTCGPVATSNVSGAFSVNGPLAGTIAVPTGASVCTGSTKQLVLSGHSGSIQWQESSSLGGTYTDISGATSPTFTTAALNSNTYYRAKLSSGSCTPVYTAAQLISVDPLSVAGTISGSSGVCSGSTSTLTLSGHTGTIVWTNATQLNGTYNSVGVATPSYTTSAITTTQYYKAQVTSGTCPAVSTSAYTVSTTPLGNIGNISGSSSVTLGSTSTYSVPAVTNATSYVWNLPSGTSLASNTPNGSSVTINIDNNFAGGTISVQAQGCTNSVLKTRTLYPISTAPTLSIVSSTLGAPLFCGNTTASLSTTTTSPTQSALYEWTLPTGVSFANGTTFEDAIIEVAFSSSFNPGSISVKRISATETLIAYYNVSSLAAPATLTGPSSLCGLTTATYQALAVTGADSYEWSLPNGMTGSSTSTTINTSFVSGVAGTVKVRAIQDGCGVSPWKSLSVGSLATPGSISGPTNVCGASANIITTSGTVSTIQSNTATYSIAAVTGATGYTWSVNNSNMTISSGQGTNEITVTYDLSQFTSGTISVLATGSSGCTSGSRTLNVTKTSATISGPTIVCDLTTATYSINAPSGSTVTWALPSWMTPATNYTLNSNPILVNIAEGPSSQTLSATYTTACGAMSASRSVGCGLFTQLSSASCGSTLPSVGWGISANTVIDATSYQFHITDPNGATYSVVSPDRWITLSEATGMPLFYGEDYAIKVRVQLDGTYGAYGASCTISTPALPITTLSSASCGTTLPSIGWGISANNVAAATAYRFNITIPSLGATVYTVESPDRWFTLSEAMNGATSMPLLYGVSYSVKVQVESGTGNWGAEGAACTVTTPTLPTTTLSAASCGATLPSIGWGISATNIAAATAYRFNITIPAQGATVYNIVSPDRWITLSEATNLPLLYGTTYSITVQVESGTGNWGAASTACTVTTPTLPTTTLSTASCGATLPSIGWGISATNVAAATAYRFNITVPGNATPFVVESVDRWITLSEAANMPLLYSTIYSITVQAESGAGNWSAPSTSCTVTTPSLPTTTLSTASCGTTLPSLGWGISANNIAAATMYEFEITGPDNTVHTVQSVDRWITLSEATSMSLYNGSAYSIRVKVENGTGTWGAFGASCTVTTPGTTLTGLTTASCGATVTATTTINIISVAGAENYNVQFIGSTNPSQVYDFTTVSTSFTINDVNAYLATIPNSTLVLEEDLYTVKVQYTVDNDAWSSYGPICTLNYGSNGLMAQDPELYEEANEGIVNQEEETFVSHMNPIWTATATSNPFELSFKVNLNGAEAIESNAMFTATLTDMSGKVYTAQILSKEALTEEHFGQDLAPGMYMLTLRQGEELRVLRVVKR